MENNRIIRSICYFSKLPSNELPNKLDGIETKLSAEGFTIQTKRVCTGEKSIKTLCETIDDKTLYRSIGSITTQEVKRQFNDFLKHEKATFNIDLTDGVNQEDVDFLFEIIKKMSGKTFSFAYVFNNAPSSPFFPSATFEEDGFSLGLQPTDLSEDCTSIEEWLEQSKQIWNEIHEIFKNDPNFLGIDSSVAPLFSGKSSFVNFIKRIGLNFSQIGTTDNLLKITNFIKRENPKPIGLCGLMLPCLEDFELAEEYESGNFSVEKNIYLSLHSGLGIDTYPIGIDETPSRIFEILQLIRGLSNKHQKPLSARFVSDGKAKIGEKSDFKNEYLKDVTVRKL